jgi:4-hydroxybenzoate polyprenyltransferase
MSPITALLIASLLTIIGITLLYMINPKTAMFGAISIFLYTSVYTPLKTVTSLSVFVGAAFSMQSHAGLGLRREILELRLGLFFCFLAIHTFGLLVGFI